MKEKKHAENRQKRQLEKLTDKRVTNYRLYVGLYTYTQVFQANISYKWTRRQTHGSEI